MKKTAIAPSNIAFIKYWGKRDEETRLPENGSISMNLSAMETITTIEFTKDLLADEVMYNGDKDAKVSERIIKQLDRIRKKADCTLFAKVVTKNTFPSETGLSSSASGFAALTKAAVAALDLPVSEKEISVLSRLGSGSACRSIPDGFVEWLDSQDPNESYAVSLYPPDYWDIADVVAIVSTGHKDVSTAEGMSRSQTSPFFETRLKRMPAKIKNMKKYLSERNFLAFGELVEEEALELHAIMLTSIPSLIYWQPGTLEVMKHVKKWRAEGLSCYFTVNTGQDIHILCEKLDVDQLVEKLSKIDYVSKTIINYPAPGARLTQGHLF